MNEALDLSMGSAAADFDRGIAEAGAGNWQAAVRSFALASRVLDRETPAYARARAWEGLALVMVGERHGLALCREAAALALLFAEPHECLARAHLKLGQRREACAAIGRGLRIDPNHAGLRQLRLRLGVRRPPPLPFLDRDNPLNRMLGRLTYRRR